MVKARHVYIDKITHLEKVVIIPKVFLKQGDKRYSSLNAILLTTEFIGRARLLRDKDQDGIVC